MEIPTLGQFKLQLEEDKAFRDYFNAFLNLPIFCRRFTYNAAVKRFENDPPFHSSHHFVEGAAVVSWIHRERLPLFWNSHLYNEYKLCLQITRDNDCLSCSESSGLAGVSGMQQFRQFLSETEGESGCLFWLDVHMHTLHTAQSEATAVVASLVTRIQRTYVNEDAPFRLSHAIRAELTAAFCHISTEDLPKKCHSHQVVNNPYSNAYSRRIQAITKAQAQVIESLRSYWCKKYVGTLQDTSRTISVVMRNGSSIGKQPSISLPHIVTDEDHSNDDQTVPVQPHVKLPYITGKSGSSCSITKRKKAPHSISGKSPLLKSLFSPSSTELFPRSNTPSTHEPQPIKNDYFHLDPFLNASLRADSLAGNPFLSHLSTSSNCDSKVSNYLLFWQSVEVMFIQDEMRRWYQSRRMKGRQLQREKECPYVTHTELYTTAKNPREVVELFLREGSRYVIALPRHIRDELMVLLPKGLGQSLLMSVQEFAAQQLLRPWKEFLSHDNHQFLQHCTTQRILAKLSPLHREQHHSLDKASLSPTEIAQHTYGSSRLKCMWTALRLAEAAKYPGISCLPSRRLTDVSLGTTTREENVVKDEPEEEADGDIQAKDLTGVSLNPMVTTIQCIRKQSSKKTLHKVLSVTKPVRSREHDIKKKQVLPGSFKEILKDPEQMELFHAFLVAQGSGSELQLLLWLAIEDVKSTVSNGKVCSRKMGRIVKKFIAHTETKKLLQYPDSVLSDLGSLHTPNPLQLLSVQSAMREAMERHWYGRYLASLTVEDKKTKEEKREADQKQPTKIPVCVEHTKDLWRMFTHGVISFRRGLMNPDTAEDFKSYLKEEVVRGSSGKKVIGTKVVYVTKLLNDLSFWAEVERYKDLADIVNATKLGKAHTPEDDIMVHKKAHAIINCYIDSAVMPRVQVNIPNELVQYILDSVSQGEIFRGLFHEAALSIFSVLILYWKKYLMNRYTHRKSLVSSHTHQKPHPHTRQPRDLQKVASIDIFHPDNHILIDIGPTLSFSLSTGLRWTHPAYRQHFEFRTTDSLSPLLPHHNHHSQTNDGHSSHNSQTNDGHSSHNSQRSQMHSSHHLQPGHTSQPRSGSRRESESRHKMQKESCSDRKSGKHTPRPSSNASASAITPTVPALPAIASRS